MLRVHGLHLTAAHFAPRGKADPDDLCPRLMRPHGLRAAAPAGTFPSGHQSLRRPSTQPGHTAVPPQQHIPAPSQPQPGVSAGVRGSRPLGTQECSPRAAPKRSHLPAALFLPTAAETWAHPHLREGCSVVLGSYYVLFPGSTTSGNIPQNTCELYCGKRATLSLCYQAEIKEGAYIRRQSVHLERAALLRHSETPPDGTENG